MKLGCHAVMFAGRLATDTENVISQISETGFQGIEAGARFVPLNERSVLMKALADHHLELSAIHYLSNEWTSNPQKAIAGAVEEAKFMAGTANPNINFSYHHTEGENYANTAKIFDEAALACRELGVTLSYHNHAHEFAENGAFYYSLLNNAPNLHFAFDMGWIKRGGFEPLNVLKEAEGRCTYVHLRDPDNGPNNWEVNGQLLYRFPDLGDGMTDLKAQLAFLQAYMPENGWVVVEYEGGEPDAARYTRARKTIDSLLA